MRSVLLGFVPQPNLLFTHPLTVCVTAPNKFNNAWGISITRDYSSVTSMTNLRSVASPLSLVTRKITSCCPTASGVGVPVSSPVAAFIFSQPGALVRANVRFYLFQKAALYPPLHFKSPIEAIASTRCLNGFPHCAFVGILL